MTPDRERVLAEEARADLQRRAREWKEHRERLIEREQSGDPVRSSEWHDSDDEAATLVMELAQIAIGDEGGEADAR